LETRTLCKSCAGDYIEAGYFVKKKEFQFIREPCDICSRSGYEYEITKAGGGDKVECG
jgi:hypothetical protein